MPQLLLIQPQTRSSSCLIPLLWIAGLVSECPQNSAYIFVNAFVRLSELQKICGNKRIRKYNAVQFFLDLPPDRRRSYLQQVPDLFALSKAAAADFGIHISDSVIPAGTRSVAPNGNQVIYPVYSLLDVLAEVDADRLIELGANIQELARFSH